MQTSKFSLTTSVEMFTLWCVWSTSSLDKFCRSCMDGMLLNIVSSQERFLFAKTRHFLHSCQVFLGVVHTNTFSLSKSCRDKLSNLLGLGKKKCQFLPYVNKIIQLYEENLSSKNCTAVRRLRLHGCTTVNR